MKTAVVSGATGMIASALIRVLVEKGVRGAGNLNKEALHFVTAVAQSDAIERLLPVLSEKETEIYKRGRNQHSASIPKSASAAQYRRATGFEALIGYLYLEGKEDRLKEVLNMAYDALCNNE